MVLVYSLLAYFSKELSFFFFSIDTHEYKLEFLEVLFKFYHNHSLLNC